MKKNYVCPICGTELDDRNVMTDDYFENCYLCDTCYHITRIEYIGEGVKSEDGYVLCYREYDEVPILTDMRWPG